MILVSLIAAGSAPMASAQDRSTAKIDTFPVADGVYMLAGGGGNIGVLVGEDGALLIDAGYEELVEKTAEIHEGSTETHKGHLASARHKDGITRRGEKQGAAVHVVRKSINLLSRITDLLDRRPYLLN